MTYLNNSAFSLLSFSEEFFVILLVFSFLNLVFSIIFLELLWPTHFFNFRTQPIFKKYNSNTYQSSILKTHKFNLNFVSLYFFKNFK